MAAFGAGLCSDHLCFAVSLFVMALITLIYCFNALCGNTLRRVVRTICRHFHELLGRIFC